HAEHAVGETVAVEVLVEVTAGRHHVDARTVVGVPGAFVGDVGRAHRDHPGAPAGREGRGVDVGVARRHHHDDVIGDEVQRALPGGRARPRPAQAHVHHVGRVGVGGHTGDPETGRPHQAITDVGQGATTVTQHPHRQDLRLPIDARHTHAVVAGGADGAGHVRAVITLELHGVVRIGIARVTVTRDVGLGYEVVAGHDPPREIRVTLARVSAAVQDAGIQDRHHHRVGAGGDVPRALHVDGVVMPLTTVERVVRHLERL